jgi:hypothetical protein
VETAANLLGFVGVLLLAWPAFYAARYGALFARLRKIDPLDPRLAETHEQAKKNLQDKQGEWGPVLSWCLRLGVVCAAASYLVLLIKPWFDS